MKEYEKMMQLLLLVQEEITCPLCFEIFRQPKSLNCVHTFCQSCLQLIVERHSKEVNLSFPSISCPLCRKKTHLEGGLEDLKCNIYLANIADYFRDFALSSLETPQLPSSLPSNPTTPTNWDMPLSPKFTGYLDLAKKSKFKADFPPKSCGFDFSYLPHIEDLDLDDTKGTPSRTPIINNPQHIIYDSPIDRNYFRTQLEDDLQFFGEYEDEESNNSNDNLPNIIEREIDNDENDLTIYIPSPFCPENGVEISVGRRKAQEIFQLWISKSWFLQKNKSSLILPKFKDFQAKFAIFYSYNFTAEVAYEASFSTKDEIIKDPRKQSRSLVKGIFRQQYTNYLSCAEPDPKIRFLLKKFEELKILVPLDTSDNNNNNNSINNNNNNNNNNNINNVYNINISNMYNNNVNVNTTVNETTTLTLENGDVFLLPLTPLLSPPKGTNDAQNSNSPPISPPSITSNISLKNLPPWYQIWNEDDIAKEVEKMEKKRIKKHLKAERKRKGELENLKIEIENIKLNFSNIKYKLLCFPLYLANYSLDRRRYYFAISAFSGVIHGEKPLGGFIGEPFLNPFRKFFPSPSLQLMNLPLYFLECTVLDFPTTENMARSYIIPYSAFDELLVNFFAQSQITHRYHQKQ